MLKELSSGAEAKRSLPFFLLYVNSFSTFMSVNTKNRNNTNVESHLIPAKSNSPMLYMNNIGLEHCIQGPCGVQLVKRPPLAEIMIPWSWD